MEWMSWTVAAASVNLAERIRDSVTVNMQAHLCAKKKWITIFEVHFILSSNETVITGYYQFARHAFNCTTHFFLFFNYARKCARNGFRIVATNRCSIHVFFRTCMAACRERRGEREMKVTALSSWHSSTQHSCLLAHTASYDDADENLTFFFSQSSPFISIISSFHLVCISNRFSFQNTERTQTLNCQSNKKPIHVCLIYNLVSMSLPYHSNESIEYPYVRTMSFATTCLYMFFCMNAIDIRMLHSWNSPTCCF